ncbi:MAG TPA: hypothetical protein VN767_04330 [Streptosporangiaceae bacterium]|nr:hypothetical protein [Streptosporangiaceae bacterium]
MAAGFMAGLLAAAGVLAGCGTAGNNSTSCPLNAPFRNQVIFEPASAKARELVVMILSCGFVQVRVDGKTQPTLVDRGDLRTLIEHLVKGAVSRAGHRPPPPVS